MFLDNIAYIVNSYGSLILSGLGVTALITVTSFAIGFLGGLAISVLRVYSSRAVKVLLTAFVEVIRGTPMMVQLFFVYYALPSMGIVFDPITASIIAIGVNSAAYQSEYLRSAISAVPYSQFEAALSLGLPKYRAVANAVLPQALRIAVPLIVNEAVYLFKYSSIAYFVTAPELMYVGKFIGAKTFLFIEVYTILALIYIAVSIAVSEIARVIEKKVLKGSQLYSV